MPIGGYNCPNYIWYMLNLFSAVVFHRSLVNWRGDICPKYKCILLYVKLLGCNGIP